MNCEQKFGSKWLVMDFNKSQISPVTAFTSITWQQHITVSFYQAVKVKKCVVDIFLGVGLVNVEVLFKSFLEWMRGKKGRGRGTRRQRRLTAGGIFQGQEIFLKSRRFSWRTGEMTLKTPKEWGRHCFHAGGMSGDEQLARFENQIKNECKLL